MVQNKYRVCTAKWLHLKPILANSLTPGFSGRCRCNLNSLAPGKFEWNFRYVTFICISVIDGWGTSCEIAIIRMSLDSHWFTDGQSTLVQVMAWCHQATSHYLSQCWPRSLSSYGVKRPRWVKLVIFKLISRIDISHISWEIALRWMPQCLTINKSTLVPLMAWCHQATSHYLIQYWFRLMMLYSAIRPQYINSLSPVDAYTHHWAKSSLVQVMTCYLNQWWLVVNWTPRIKLQ